MKTKKAVKESTVKIPPRFPRKLRRKIMKELDQEKSRLEKKVLELYSKTQGRDPIPDYSKEAARTPKRQPITLFGKGYEPNPENRFEYLNALTGRKEVGQLVKVIWPERGRLEIPDGDKTKLQESWKQVSLKPEQVKKYFKDNAQRIELKEVGWNDWDDMDFNGQVPVAQVGKYFPYPPSSFTRQMYQPDQWFMLARCAHAYNYNPLAKAGVDIKNNFVVGTGPRVIIKNPQLKSAWAQFEKDEDFIETLRTWSNMSIQNGELFVEFFTDQKGNPTVRSIDPGHVYDTITEPRDIRKVYGYKLMYQTQYQIFGEGARGEQVPLSQWIYETVKPDNIMHLKFNVQENEKRGRSDLLPVLAICQLFEDYIRYKVIRAIVLAAFVWDAKLENADQAEIDAFLAEQGNMPPPLSVRAHNERVTWEVQQHAGAAAGGRDDVFEMLVNLFAVGIGVPKEYMGAGDHSTRSSAITSTEPAVKEFMARQHKIETLVLRIVDYLAQTKGIQYEPDDVEVAWPEIAPENIKEKVERLYEELLNNTFTKQRVDEMIAKEEGVSNYDWTEEMQNRLAELTQGITKSLADGSTPIINPSTISPSTAGPKTGTTPTAAGAPPTPVKSVTGTSNQDRTAAKVAGQVL